MVKKQRKMEYQSLRMKEQKRYKLQLRNLRKYYKYQQMMRKIMWVILAKNNEEIRETKSKNIDYFEIY